MSPVELNYWCEQWYVSEREASYYWFAQLWLICLSFRQRIANGRLTVCMLASASENTAWCILHSKMARVSSNLAVAQFLYVRVCKILYKSHQEIMLMLQWACALENYWIDLKRVYRGFEFSLGNNTTFSLVCQIKWFYLWLSNMILYKISCYRNLKYYFIENEHKYLKLKIFANEKREKNFKKLNVVYLI